MLDAGCGTGYLSHFLCSQGGEVVGVDFSEKMIEIAKGREKEEKEEKRKGSVTFRIDSVASLSTIQDESVDRIVSNYVLMDVEDLEGAVASFFRVLKPKGHAVLVFSHPCFPGGYRINKQPPPTNNNNNNNNTTTIDKTTTYYWPHPYFTPKKVADAPWAHFKEDFIWFHRPLSTYFKAFRAVGFVVEEFEEPSIQPEQYHLVSEEVRERAKCRPFSVAFKLVKP